MVNLSVSVDMIPQKSHYSVANDIVYISVTFDGDEKAREFVAKMFLCFKSQKKAVVIEDASLYNYKGYSHGTELLEFGDSIIALDANYNDVLKVISNWCFYEIGASIYFMDDNTNYCALLSKQSNCHRVGKKDFTNVLDRNASVSIHQELDYTVNVFCKKSTFGTVWDILKKEKFDL